VILIDLEHPNYQFVAARLLLFSIRKSIFGKMRDLPNLSKHVFAGVDNGIYDRDLITKYTMSDYADLDRYMDHDRDFLFTYAGLRQVVDKYLVQDRSSGKVFETNNFSNLESSRRKIYLGYNMDIC